MAKESSLRRKERLKGKKKSWNITKKKDKGKKQKHWEIAVCFLFLGFLKMFESRSKKITTLFTVVITVCRENI